jgi:hypothetical protein
MRWVFVIGLLIAGCASQPEHEAQVTEAPPITILYASSYGILTIISVPCDALPEAFELRNTTITDATLRKKIRQYSEEPRFLNESDSLTHVDARKWVILQTASGADTLCLGDLWGLQRKGQVEGFADSLVVFVNSIVYDSEVASQRRRP